MAATKHRSPDLKYSTVLPDRLKLAIADSVTLYARIENLAVEILWEIEQADLERRKEIARKFGDQNFKLLKDALQQLPSAKTNKIWPTLKALTKERNLIAHGTWMWTEDDRAMVIWHAKMLEEADWIGAEFFDWARFDSFIRKTTLLVNMFAGIKLLVVQLVDAEKAKAPS
jgi:hypothetical protein